MCYHHANAPLSILNQKIAYEDGIRVFSRLTRLVSARLNGFYKWIWLSYTLSLSQAFAELSANQQPEPCVMSTVYSERHWTDTIDPGTGRLNQRVQKKLGAFDTKNLWDWPPLLSQMFRKDENNQRDRGRRRHQENSQTSWLIPHPSRAQTPISRVVLGSALDIGQISQIISWLPIYKTMIIYYSLKIQYPIKSSPATSTNHFKHVPAQDLTPFHT